MASDSTGMLLKVGLFGGAAWLAYKQGWLSMFGLSPAPAPAPAPASPTSTSPPMPVGASSLDGIHQQLSRAAKAPAVGLNVDSWGYFLNQILSASGKGAAPDPMPLFSAAIPGFDRSQLVTDIQYWTVMAPALKDQLGLSGLGFYGGLGAVVQKYQRRYA
jgi:hypothetical protein